MFETTLIAAIALVFILEGLLPFVFPRMWKKIMTEATQLPERGIRIMGVVSISIGMVILLFFTQ